MTPTAVDPGPLRPAERRELTALQRQLARYRRPCPGRSALQLLSCLVPGAMLWVAMLRLGPEPGPAMVGLAVLEGLVMLRLFGLYHDLAHGSMFRSRAVNEAIGCVVGVLMLTPYHHWRRDHVRHHAAVADLDRRGPGDVPMLTLAEYERAPWPRRLTYRLFRQPLVTFVGAGAYLFLVRTRIPRAGAGARERASVHLTTLASSTLLVAAGIGLGPAIFLATVVPAYLTLATCAMWLYNIQHFFGGVHLRRASDWDYARGCLEGSSYYRLPRVLRWLSANTGYHHLHHLLPRVPNYHLPRCQAALERLAVGRRVRPVTLRSSLRVVRWGLYDEHRHALVGFPPLFPASLRSEDAGHAGP